MLYVLERLNKIRIGKYFLNLVIRRFLGILVFQYNGGNGLSKFVDGGIVGIVNFEKFSYDRKEKE